MGNMNLTPEELEKAKRAQKKKLVFGFVGLALIIILVAGYKTMQNMAENADTNGSIVATPKVDSNKADAPVVVDRTALYAAQRNKARADSQIMKPKADTIMKMVSGPIVNNKIGSSVDAAKPVASKPERKTVANSPVLASKSAIEPKNKTPVHHTLKSKRAGGVQPKEAASENVGFNFVYNSGKKSSPKPAGKQSAASPANTGGISSMVSGAGYSNYSASVHNEATKPIEGRLIATMRVQDGDAVGIKLDQDLVLSNGTVHAGSLIYGKASLSANRVNINIANVESDKGIIGVTLQVLGADMIDGIKATVKKSKVDATGVPSAAASMVTSQLGTLGSLLGSVRSRQNSNADPEYYIEAGKKCYIKSN